MTRIVASTDGKNKAGAKWFRSWRSKINSRKVFALTDAQYRFWDLCLCATDVDGYLPSIKDLAFILRMQPRDVEARIAELIELRFIDPIMIGASPAYRMHDWEEWQRRCDAVDQTVSERMKRYRKRKKKAANRNAAVTVTEFRSESVSASVPNYPLSKDPAKKESEGLEVSDYAREGR